MQRRERPPKDCWSLIPEDATGLMATIEQRKMWTESIVAIKPVASSGIMTNNLSVAFTTFALGITAGIGNDLDDGGERAADRSDRKQPTWKAGMALQLWSFVAPHGVLEFAGDFIAAGAGWRLRGGCCSRFCCREENRWLKREGAERGCCSARSRLL